MTGFISYNTKHIKDLSQLALKYLFWKNGLIDSEFVFRWKEIIGNYFGDYCYPIKFTFPKKDDYRNAILTIYVDRGAALELDYQKERVIERINQYFGYKMVSKLLFKQGYFQNKNYQIGMAKKNQKIFAEKEVDELIENVDNQEIKAALKSLGNAMKR